MRALRDGSGLLVRLRALGERVRQSLFFVPALALILAAGLAQAAVAVDERVDDGDLPELLLTSVDNARAILTAIASGTITAASVLFSLMLVAVQLSASQFSPRTLRRFLGDRGQQVAIGIVLGTFAYSVLVLRVVHSSLDGEGPASVPHVSVSLAVLASLASLLAMMATMDRTARRMRVGSVVADVTAETLCIVRARFPRHGEDGAPPPLQDPDLVPDAGPREPPATALAIEAERSGWVQQLASEALSDVLREELEGEATVLVVATAGSFLIEGQPWAWVWPAPARDEARERLRRRLARAIAVGETRTMQQDVAYGIVQLVDVALRALSPGVNDPHTAQEVLARLGAVLLELSVSELVPARLERDGVTILRDRELLHADYVDLALEPVRRHGRADPRVLTTLVRTLASVRDEALRRSPRAVVEPLQQQAAAVAAELDALAQPADRERVREALRAAGFEGRG